MIKRKNKMKQKSQLKRKILLMTMSITIIWLIICLISIAIISYEYNQIAIKQSDKLFSMFMYNLDINMEKIEETVFNIIADPVVYDDMNDINYSDEDYTVYLAKKDLAYRLSTYLKLNQYVKTTYYIPNNKIYINTFPNTLDIDDSIINNTIDYVDSSTLRTVWIKPTNDFPYAIVAKKISKTEFEWERELGTILFIIDLQSMSADMQSYTNDEYGFYLLDQKNNLVSLSSSIMLSQSYSNTQSKNKLINDNGRILLTSQYISSYNNWRYINVMNYSSLIDRIFKIIFLMIVILILTLLSTILYSLGIISSIVNPVKDLIYKTHKAIEGDYSSNIPAKKVSPNDEIGTLNYDFNKMLEHINELINENLASQLEAKDFQYRMLQAQINPHLLYNTLETISWRTSISGDHETQQIIYALGKLLRNSINNSQMTISLKEEISNLEYYIKIQKHRYEERLNINIEIEEKHLNIIVPKLILQPLIENSIKYGVESRINGANIKVFSSEENNKLILTIKDDGIGMDEDISNRLLSKNAVSKGTGLGIKNIHARIQSLYGNNYGLSITSKNEEGTTVKIALPLD